MGLMVDITINSFYKNEGYVIMADEITKRVSLVGFFYGLMLVYMVSRVTEMIHLPLTGAEYSVIVNLSITMSCFSWSFLIVASFKPTVLNDCDTFILAQ